MADITMEPQLQKPALPISTERSSLSSEPISNDTDIEAQPQQSEKLEKLSHVKSVDDAEYPHGIKLFLVLTSIYLAVFLMALVGTPHQT